MTPPLAPNQVAARLERLPVGRYHYRFLFWISLGGWFDFFDNFVAGPLVEALQQDRILPRTEPAEWLSPVGLFMAALPLGMFLGTMFFGLAFDHLGRRFGFIAMLLLYSLATLAGAIGYHPVTELWGLSAGLMLLLATRLLAVRKVLLAETRKATGANRGNRESDRLSLRFLCCLLFIFILCS